MRHKNHDTKNGSHDAAGSRGLDTSISLMQKSVMPERKPSSRGEEADGENDKAKSLFELGQVVGTPGAIQALQNAGQDPFELLYRHVTGDWGELDDEDKKENELSVEQGFRILSAYKLETGVKVWLITEADRSATTFLLPEEY